MMQMLDAGGLPPKTDAQRAADEDNPKGYYEWEDIKRVKAKPTMLLEDGLQGKAIKAVTMVLQDLPFAHNYKVIFMNRPIEEVVASQTKMLKRDGTPETEEENQERMRKEMLWHRIQARRRVEANPRMEVLDVDYPNLIENPVEMSQLIAEFLGAERIVHPEAMSAVVDPSLHRQKTN